MTPTISARASDREHEDVLFLADLAKWVRMSTRTLARRLRAGTFPIPELPRLDHRRRWSNAVVTEWLAKEAHPVPDQVVKARHRQALRVVARSR